MVIVWRKISTYCTVLVALSLNTKDGISLQIMSVAMTMIPDHAHLLSYS